MFNMNKNFVSTLIFLGVICCGLHAQIKDRNIPITIGVFSESVSLPNFKNILKKPNLGFKIGTEFYYKSKSGHRWLQTVNMGAYFHKGLHNAFFIKSELGYRKNYGQGFSDIFLGGGYSLQRSFLPAYQLNADGNYVKSSNLRHTFMPAISLGSGYRLNSPSALFARYEIFGETPFNFNGNPVLVHKAVEMGSRIVLNR